MEAGGGASFIKYYALIIIRHLIGCKDFALVDTFQSMQYSGNCELSMLIARNLCKAPFRRISGDECTFHSFSYAGKFCHPLNVCLA